MAFGTLWRLRFCDRLAGAVPSLLRRNLGSETLPSLQRRSERLHDLLRRMRRGRVESFWSGGRTYQLPLSSTTEIRRQASQDEIEYLNGFFDGDGCVSMEKRTGHLRLQISQSIHQASILLRFRDMIGGGVYHERDATGVASASLRWQAHGCAVTFAATALSTAPSMKQAQLQIAAQGPVCTMRRTEVHRKLKALKHASFRPAAWLPCSWSYFAGFFDAEGSIGVHPLHASLALTISQANPYILHCLAAFLHDQGMDHWIVRENGKDSSLCCTHFGTAKASLQLLLDHGLFVKEVQAKLALEMATANSSEVRLRLFAMKGNQQRYNRLDDAGVDRAKEIERLRAKLRSDAGRQGGGQVESSLRGLRALQEEHAVHKLASKCRELRKQARAVLREGAVVISREAVAATNVEPCEGRRLCSVKLWFFAFSHLTLNS